MSKEKPDLRQVAYEAYANKVIELDYDRRAFPVWDEKTNIEMFGWEAAAKAVIAALRSDIEALLADVTGSAEATRPSRKTEVEDEFAIALRRLLETE